MIVIKIFGGLGNQMFQYAFGKALSKKHKSDLYLDLSWFDENSTSTFRKFQLNLFNTEYFIADKRIIKTSKPLLYRFLNTALLKLKIGKLQMPKYFIENTIAFNDSINIINENCYVNGYWQSEKYFKHIEYDLRSDFSLKYKLLSEISNSLLLQIQSTESIAVHIRRSDYNLKHNIDIHGILPISYYEESMKFMADNLKDPNFFIFSDDIEWAQKAIINKDGNIHYITKNPNYIDLFLNSQCKHNIIANSTFSWWSAWLNNNENKLIIAPKKWYNNESMNNQTTDLIPESWFRI